MYLDKRNIVKKVSYIDPDTHELVDVSQLEAQNYVTADKESFYQLYAGFIGLLQDGVDKSEMKVFGYLIENYQNNNIFTIGRAVKEDMESRLGVKLRTIEGCLVALRQPRSDGTALLLYNPQKKSYCINPRYIIKSFNGKGDRMHKVKFCISSGFDSVIPKTKRALS